MWLVTAFVAYATNAAWELAQRPLYAAGQDVTRCLVAAGWDAAYTIAALAMASAARQRWGRPAYWSTLILALLFLATGIELWALTTDRWSYSSAMPTVVGLGLSPVTQLPLLGAIVALLHIAATTRRRRFKPGRHVADR